MTVIPGGIRYRDQLGEMHLKTGADGKVEINWAEPGMYWVNVTTPQPARAEGGEGGPPPASAPPQRRASYVTTLEVLAP